MTEYNSAFNNKVIKYKINLISIKYLIFNNNIT